MATWQRRGLQWVPGRGDQFVAEGLIASVMALGTFRERSLVVGRTRYEFSFDARIPSDQERCAMQRLGKVVRYVHERFGRDLGPTYRTIVSPPAESGDDLTGDGWADGQGGTLAPATTARVHRFAERLIDAYLLHPPYRTEVTRPEEYWIVDGVRRLYAWRAVARTGLMNDEDVRRDVVSAYLLVANVGGEERNLEKLYTSSQDTRYTRDYFTPVALLSLDRLIREVTNSTQDLDTVVRRLYGGRLAPSLWRALPEAPAQTWERFRSREVIGAQHLSAEDIPYVRPTREKPEPAAGACVRHVTVAYTGQSFGFLENCGCKANQSGGVARRATVLKRIRSRDPETILLDAGNAFARTQAGQGVTFLGRKEQQLYLHTMDMMRYDAAAVGTSELLLGPDYFHELSRGTGTIFLASNVAAQTQPVAPPARLVRRAGLRIGIIGVLGPRRGRFLSPLFEESLSKLTCTDPVDAVNHEADSLRTGADLIIVIGDIAPETVRRIAARCANIDVIISSSLDLPNVSRSAQGVSLEDTDHSGFLGRTLVLYTAARQYGLGSARIGLDAEGRVADVSIRDVLLGDDVRDDATVRQALSTFYDRIGSDEAAQRSVSPLFGWDAARLNGRYVGASACKTCHEHEYSQWAGTAHATAFRTLLDRHRNYQPSCISCHVVGYGSAFGYRVGAAEGRLGNVQCEVCHGPGAAHVLEPGNANIQRDVPERVCLECHNTEHSDGFVYAEKLPRVRHDMSH